MLLLMIGIAAWLLLVVFVCALGRAAKAGDRVELERLQSARGQRAGIHPSADVGDGLTSRARIPKRDDPFRRELLDFRPARGKEEARLAQLDAQGRIGAA